MLSVIAVSGVVISILCSIHVQCTLYILHCIQGYMYRIINSCVHYSRYNVQCTLYILHCIQGYKIIHSCVRYSKYDCIRELVDSMYGWDRCGYRVIHFTNF